MGRKRNTQGARAGRRAERARRWIGTTLAVVLAAGTLVGASPAVANEYDSTTAGHPLRIVAYVLHPVGVALDYLILRPAHWLVSHEPFKTAFGYED